MKTHTMRLIATPDAMVKIINRFEADGWTVKQIIMNEATHEVGGGSIVVLEKDDR